MYREVVEVQDGMDDLQNRLRDAFLANDTRDITMHATVAQALADQALRRLQSSLEDHEPGIPQVERRFVELAVQELSQAVEQAQRVAAGTTVMEMHEGLIPFKTHADYADAYIRIALGG